jgi:hypothetical protein
MKLYRVTCHHPDMGLMVAWAATKAAAIQAAHDLEQECEGTDGEAGSADWERVEVPTTKQALVGWLNTNLCLDNG